MGGCVAYQPSAQVSPDFKPRDALPVIQEMNAAHRQGAVEFVAGRGARIPVRVFGTNGTRRPVIMTHGLESHSGWFVQSAAFAPGRGPAPLGQRTGSYAPAEPNAARWPSLDSAALGARKPSA